jgi:hypothetical protein
MIDISSDFWKLAIPVSTLFMAFASAFFSFLAWRSEGTRRRAEARRLRLESASDELAELFAAFPHDRTKWDTAFNQTFVEKLCKVDFKIDEENPHAKPLVEAIQKLLPIERQGRDGEHMTHYNSARTIAKDYLNHEWSRFKTETGLKD